MSVAPRIASITAALLLGMLVAAPSATAKPKHIPPGHAKQMAPGHGENGPPPHAPAHGYRNKYRFYPEQNLYYDITRDIYFHYDDGRWRQYDHNPVQIQLGPFFSIQMDTDTPYTRFDEHKREFRVLP
jgi:hypothetical protein